MTIEFGPGNYGPRVSVPLYPMQRAIIHHFKDKAYGKKPLVLVYDVRCINDRAFDLPEDILDYDSEHSTVYCSIDLNFDIAFRYRMLKDLLSYFANCFLNKNQDLCELPLRDFDVSAFMNDLEKFFEGYLTENVDKSIILQVYC